MYVSPLIFYGPRMPSAINLLSDQALYVSTGEPPSLDPVLHRTGRTCEGNAKCDSENVFGKEAEMDLGRQGLKQVELL